MCFWQRRADADPAPVQQRRLDGPYLGISELRCEASTPSRLLQIGVVIRLSGGYAQRGRGHAARNHAQVIANARAHGLP
jgi:hypothetical protein